ncbi:hypothetical protein [Desulfovibrio sp. UCD-KL4C]|uniref:hypothetical protein n=1 Tax=Desulfovibrio sp. UCD-KL4C TaxID=2578120 RepID=UPI0025BEE571|nr:hypothetical protein [Desulfovibrio sp. UCD-KL4C]
MTALFNILIKNNIGADVVPVRGKWAEADSMSDVAAYESKILQFKQLKTRCSHDWRVKK